MPPTDTKSPIELAAYSMLAANMKASVGLDEQVEVPTPWGDFRLDLVAYDGDRRVAFECDGAEFHKDEGRDAWRDALILGERGADVIYRLPGTAIHCHPMVLTYLLTRREPQLFERKTRVTLGILCADARSAVLRHEQQNGPSYGPWRVEWVQTTEGPDDWGHANWDVGETRTWAITITRRVLSEELAFRHQFALHVGPASVKHLRNRYAAASADERLQVWGKITSDRNAASFARFLEKRSDKEVRQ